MQSESTHLAKSHDDIEPAIPLLYEGQHTLVCGGHLGRCWRPVPAAVRAWIHVGDAGEGVAEIVAIDERELVVQREKGAEGGWLLRSL
jgi:hypothetical protein